MTSGPLPPVTTEHDRADRTAGGPFLIVMRQGKLFAYPLRRDRPLVVGRSNECDIVVDTAGLSRRHFTVSAGPPVLLTDLGSANGTMLGGRTVPARTPVAVSLSSFIEAAGVSFVLHDRLLRGTQVIVPTESAATEPGAPGAIVEDPVMKALYEQIELVARSTLSVLVTGETGVGKEVVAAHLHAKSMRRHRSFVTLNCAALPETLLESELFGYERGAFTGAVQAKPGILEAADGGTVFLDEIGEMPLRTQAKLLRVLETGEIARVGAVTRKQVDLRFLAATNRDLPSLVARGDFRRDLYFRLNGVTLHVPPLRERVAELEALVAHFIALGARRTGRRAPALSLDAMSSLASHSWPGNVRELRNVIERALALCEGPALHADHIVLDPIAAAGATIPVPATRPSSGPPGSLRVDRDAEVQTIEDALNASRGHQGRAAEMLGISRRTLFNRIKEYAIKPRWRRPKA